MLINSQPYYIAETAFHHEGDKVFLKDLVNDLLKIDVNAIKFHLLFNIDDYIIAEHQAYEVIKKISIIKENWFDIFDVFKNSNKDIILLTNDIASLKWVNSIQKQYPIEAIELHSTGINDLFLLQEAVNFEKTVILGVGGSTLDEILFAVDFLKSNGKSDILLMHGFQNYPTDYKDINFSRINILKKLFDLPVGYADHTDPLDPKNSLICSLPQILGCNILEKHVTNVSNENRIDSQVAVSIEQMIQIIDFANASFSSLGNQGIIFSEAEKKYGNTGPMKKAIVARNDIEKGESIDFYNIAYKRTENSSPLQQKEIYKLIGSKAKNTIKKDQILNFDNVEYQFKIEDFKQFFISNNK